MHTVIINIHRKSNKSEYINSEGSLHVHRKYIFDATNKSHLSQSSKISKALIQ